MTDAVHAGLVLTGTDKPAARPQGGKGHRVPSHRYGVADHLAVPCKPLDDQPHPGYKLPSLRWGLLRSWHPDKVIAAAEPEVGLAENQQRPADQVQPVLSPEAGSRLIEDQVHFACPMQLRVPEMFEDIRQMLRAGHHHQRSPGFQRVGGEGGQARQHGKRLS